MNKSAGERNYASLNLSVCLSLGFIYLEQQSCIINCLNVTTFKSSFSKIRCKLVSEIQMDHFASSQVVPFKKVL